MLQRTNEGSRFLWVKETTIGVLNPFVNLYNFVQAQNWSDRPKSTTKEQRSDSDGPPDGAVISY